MAHEKNHDYHILPPSVNPLLGSLAALVMLTGAILWMHDNGPYIFLADLHNGSVIPHVAFSHNFAPPCVHDVKHANQAGQEDIGPIVMHPKDRSC